MKISKPKENQILIEDDNLKQFNLEVQSKTGLRDSEFDSLYEGMIFAYRQPGMDASKQMFMGSPVSIMTLTASMIENLFRYKLLSEKDIIKLVKECSRNAKEGK